MSKIKNYLIDVMILLMGINAVLSKSKTNFILGIIILSLFGILEALRVYRIIKKK